MYSQEIKVSNNSTPCRSKGFDARIRNVKTKEYLYSPADDIAVDNLRRHVFTWRDLDDIPGMAGNTWAGEQVWRVEFVGNAKDLKIRIKSTKTQPGEYLFVEKGDNGRCDVFTLVRSELSLLAELSPSTAWNLDKCLPLDGSSVAVLHNPSCSGSLIGDKNVFFDSDSDLMRRHVLVEKSDGGSQWEIIPMV